MLCRIAFSEARYAEVLENEETLTINGKKIALGLKIY